VHGLTKREPKEKGLRVGGLPKKWTEFWILIVRKPWKIEGGHTSLLFEAVVGVLRYLCVHCFVLSRRLQTRSVRLMSRIDRQVQAGRPESEEGESTFYFTLES
jgi:hypothetical protein